MLVDEQKVILVMVRVSAEGLPFLGLLQRFAWGSVRWSHFKVFLWILGVFLSVHTNNTGQQNLTFFFWHTRENIYS
jgi:hypothetical protein